jgi:hypothetical protein
MYKSNLLEYESKTKYKNKKKYAINFELIQFGFSIFPFGAYMMNGYSNKLDLYIFIGPY